MEQRAINGTPEAHLDIQQVWNEPIAIIGLGCRFPGANGVADFWQLLVNQVDAISEVPPERFDVDTIYDPRPATPGKVVTRWGGFLEHIDHFDAYFFGIAPREAMVMDPQHRLLLEVAWEAMEDAGLVPEQLSGSRTGVFVGISYNEYEDLQLANVETFDVHAGVGGVRSVAAGRISYALGLQGPSLSVDTACSSSLVAVHLACQSLWTGESAMAFAAGTNLVIRPEFSISFSQGNMLAPDGRCKAFDARANGFVRSDGVAVAILKPLSQAQADNDPVYAIIRGTAINNDGRTSGLLITPGRKGQEELLRQAYKRAGISPGMVQYIEAHGTGTNVGDPVEVQALGTVLSEGRPGNSPCRIGSVKTNIGHTESTAGLAGLIKTALALKHRLIPASLHLQTLNPKIPWDEIPLVVQREATPWPEDAAPALAGVSSFGISGTNAHAVLEEAPIPVVEPAPVEERIHLIPLTARSPEALTALARRYQDYLNNCPDLPLRDLAYTTALRRTHHDHQLTLVASSIGEVSEGLQAFLNDEPFPGLSSSIRPTTQPSGVVFVFPGQGGQWLGMGRRLLQREPVFRETLTRCATAFGAFVDWDAVEVLEGDSSTWLEDIAMVQPLTCAVQIALAALWQHWGIVPTAVVGHSMGEVAAAYVAGVLTIEDAARIICLRSQLLRRVRGQGAMAVVDLPQDEAAATIVGESAYLAVAVSNSPRSTVIAGDPGALERVLAELEAQGVFCRRIKVDVASHSPQMDPLLPELRTLLQPVHPQPARLLMLSTVTGEPCNGLPLDADYWVRNLRQPVQFATAVARLVGEGHTTFVELSPHPLLVQAIDQGLTAQSASGLVLGTLRREEDEQANLLSSLGTLYGAGYPIAWAAITPLGRCISLPTYPWQRERFWTEQDSTGPLYQQHSLAWRGRNGSPHHPLLGIHFTLAQPSGEHVWENELEPRRLPYLEDHRVQDTIVLPGTAYVEMALAAAARIPGFEHAVLENVTFARVLSFPEAKPQAVQLIVGSEIPGSATFKLFSLQGSESVQQTWTLHASGTLRAAAAKAESDARIEETLDTIQSRCVEEMSGEAHYQAMERRGLHYGTSFQGVAHIWRGDGEALGRLVLPEAVVAESKSYRLHPALLDATLQVFVAVMPQDGTENDTYLPVEIGAMRVHAQPEAELWCHARLHPRTEGENTLRGDLLLFDAGGRLIAEIDRLGARRLESDLRTGRQESITDWMYAIEWEHQEHTVPIQPVTALPQDQRSTWVVFTDNDGVGEYLRTMLEAYGETCITLQPGDVYSRLDSSTYQLNPTQPDAFRQFLVDAFANNGQHRCRGIIHLWSLQAQATATATVASLTEAQQLGCISVMHTIQALVQAGWAESPRLWIITRNAQAVSEEQQTFEPAHASVCGLGRVIAYEHPELHCTRIDLSTDVMADEQRLLFHEIWSNGSEDEIALRGTQRYVARLIQRTLTEQEDEPVVELVAAEGQPFSLEIGKPGQFNTLRLRGTTRQKPATGQVEIQVRAVGLNADDVIRAKSSSTVAFGMECSGLVVAVGEGVEEVQVGDEVIAVTPPSTGCAQAFVNVDAALVLPKPPQLSFEAAATLPLACLTAHYALDYLGRMSQGERVLIHTGTAATGLGAIQLAQRAGAEIFATAQSPDQHTLLQSLGVAHILDAESRTLGDDLLRITDGQGIDLVLNLRTGESPVRSLATLGAYGRFLDIGGQDSRQDSRLGPALCKNNLSFFAIDIDQLIQERPTLVGKLLREAIPAVTPPPFQNFPISAASQAFETMAQSEHVGKVVLTMQEPLLPIIPAASQSLLFKADATYLITGGLGGLGLAVAAWMVEQGARHLVLTGRSGVSSDTARDTIATLEKANAHVVVMQADVANAEQVNDVVATIRRTLPPLRGVIHAAGILQDGLLVQLDQERFRNVMAPKINGAWLLHTATRDEPLDYFVLFSSAAALLGSPGQGNYAAANAFMDTLAYYRRAQGLPALSINWGPWSEVGLAAAQTNRGERLIQRGFGSITPEQGVAALGYLLCQGTTQMGVMPFYAQQWVQFYPTASRMPLLARLVEQQAKTGASSTHEQAAAIRQALLAVEMGPARRARLEDHLREQVSKVLRIPASRLDTQTPLGTFGLDSLMSLELRNRLEASSGLTLTATVLWNYPTIAALTNYLAEMMDIPLDGSDDPCVDEAAPPKLSQEEGQDLLNILQQLKGLGNTELQEDIPSAGSR